MKRRPNRKTDYNSPPFEPVSELKRSGQFVNTDNMAAEFAEELSDGGERNEIAEEQAERLNSD
ncbi:hypothetical protein WD019_00600 [Fictibacillus sp. Mic-4]|uniref:hypothetical protein n=1 Tax=Fictibacillus TaxID=1329200 RepID=UPI00041CB8EF|nr:hypothetical protein [Fictibacillus gelatini]